MRLMNDANHHIHNEVIFGINLRDYKTRGTLYIILLSWFERCMIVHCIQCAPPVSVWKVITDKCLSVLTRLNKAMKAVVLT